MSSHATVTNSPPTPSSASGQLDSNSQSSSISVQREFLKDTRDECCDRSLASYSTDITDSTDQTLYSTQLIENFDITTSRSHHPTPSRRNKSESLSPSAPSLQPYTQNPVDAEICNDDVSCSSICEPRESCVPTPTVTIALDDEDNSDKMFRRRRLEFRRVMDCARQSSLEAQQSIRSITNTLPTVPEVSSNGPINLVNDGIHAIGDEPPQEYERENKTLVSSPNEGNILDPSKTPKKALGISLEKDKETKSSSTQIRAKGTFMNRKPFQPPIAQQTNEGNKTPLIVSSSQNMYNSNRKSTTLNDSKILFRSSNLLDSCTPGIVEELTGNITKDEPGQQSNSSTLIDELTGNITKQRQTSRDLTPIPGTAEHVPFDKYKYLEFESDLNKHGNKSNINTRRDNNEHVYPSLGSSRSPANGGTRRIFNQGWGQTRRSVSFRRFWNTENNEADLENGSTPSFHNAIDRLSPQAVIRRDWSSCDDNNDNSHRNEDDTNQTHGPRNWQNEPVVAVVATPVPSQRARSEDGNPSMRSTRRSQRKNPFSDRRVIAVLLFCVVTISMLSYAYIRVRQQTPIPITSTIDLPSSQPFFPQTVAPQTIAPPTLSPQTTSPQPSPPKITSQDSSSVEPPPIVDIQGDFRNFSTAIILDEEKFKFVDGCMFNVNFKGTPGVRPQYRLSSIDVLIKDLPNVPLEVWIRPAGSGYKGFEEKDSGWINTFENEEGDNKVLVNGTGMNQFTHIDEEHFMGDRPIYIWEGQTLALYVTVSNKSNVMIAQEGVMESEPYIANEYIEITDGICFSYPFQAEERELLPMRWLGSLQFVEVNPLEYFISIFP